MSAVHAGIYEAWLATTDDGVVAIDADGRVVFHNAAASRVTGLAPPFTNGRPWREILQFDPDVSDLLWSARETGRSAKTLADVLCAQGNLRTAEILGHPWTDHEGRVGVLVLIRDLAVLCRHRRGPGGRPGYGSLVGANPAMEALYDLVEAVAPSDAPLVIEGEPGVGKELVAQAIHARSRRAERPLIAVDCGAAASGLLEVELFGRQGGGPHGTATIGRAERAHSGTLFLTRIQAAPPRVQTRLLRLLETGQVEREGEGIPHPVDLRIIGATTRPLDAEVREGRFHEDLRRRLQVVRIRVPPLRERAGDVALLAQHFLARYGAERASLSPAALAVLQACDWPGNVRQLENAMRDLASRIPSGAETVIEPDLLPPAIASGRQAPGAARAYPGEDRRTLLLRALSSHGGNRTAAARALGIGRATFYRWWREAGLGGPEIRLR
jgi:two-component system response regulator HydG